MKEPTLINVFKGASICKMHGALCGHPCDLQHREQCPYGRYAEQGKRSCLVRLIDDAVELLTIIRDDGWISVKKRLPAVHDSIYANLYGTDRWKKSMWRKNSEKVIVTIVFPDGENMVTTGRLIDGEWDTTIAGTFDYAVTHWQPLPGPAVETAEKEGEGRESDG